MISDSPKPNPTTEFETQQQRPPELPWAFQWTRLLVVTGIPIVLGGLVYLIGRFDVFLMRCGFRYVSGLHCPGCGMTRMVHAMYEFQFSDAFFMNPFMFISLPILAYLYLCWSMLYTLNRRLWGYAFILRFWWIWFVLAVLFAIVRNMPYVRDFIAL